MESTSAYGNGIGDGVDGWPRIVVSLDQFPARSAAVQDTAAAVGATEEHVSNLRLCHSAVKEAKRYLNAEAPTVED